MQTFVVFILILYYILLFLFFVFHYFLLKIAEILTFLKTNIRFGFSILELLMVDGRKGEVLTSYNVKTKSYGIDSISYLAPKYGIYFPLK